MSFHEDLLNYGFKKEKIKQIRLPESVFTREIGSSKFDFIHYGNDEYDLLLDGIVIMENPNIVDMLQVVKLISRNIEENGTFDEDLC